MSVFIVVRLWSLFVRRIDPILLLHTFPSLLGDNAQSARAGDALRRRVHLACPCAYYVWGLGEVQPRGKLPHLTTRTTSSYVHCYVWYSSGCLHRWFAEARMSGRETIGMRWGWTRGGSVAADRTVPLGGPVKMNHVSVDGHCNRPSKAVTSRRITSQFKEGCLQIPSSTTSKDKKWYSFWIALHIIYTNFSSHCSKRHGTDDLFDLHRFALSPSPVSMTTLITRLPLSSFVFPAISNASSADSRPL